MSNAPYQRGSETSRAAAQAQEATLPAKEYAVYRYLLERGGATDDDLERHFVAEGWATPTARARRVRLVEKGLLRDSGLRRRTRHGKMATVWMATDRQPELFA